MVEADYELLRFWFDIIQTVGTIAIGAYVWWTNREKVTARRFANLEKEVTNRVTTEALKAVTAERDSRCALHISRTSQVELTVTGIRAEMKHAPGKEDVSELHSRITDMQKQLSEMCGRLHGIGRAVDLINEHLINQGKD